MDYLLESIEHTAAKRLMLPGVVTALTVPDVAAAATHLDGHTNGPRYAAWVDIWFHQQLPNYREDLEIDGTVLYAMRCTFLHQGLATPSLSRARPKGNRAIVKRQLCFSSGDSGLETNASVDLDGIKTTCVDGYEFVAAMAAAGRAWLKQVDSATRERLSHYVHIRNGPAVVDGQTHVICMDY